MSEEYSLINLRRVEIIRHPKLQISKNPSIYKEYFVKSKMQLKLLLAARNGEEMLEPYELETLTYGFRRGKGSNPFSLVDYTCAAYQEVTEQFINSYSKKAYPWDKACIESFHALIKREWINRF